MNKYGGSFVENALILVHRLKEYWSYAIDVSDKTQDRALPRRTLQTLPKTCVHPKAVQQRVYILATL